MAWSPLATTIFNHKYAHTKADGTKETWHELAARVSSHVVGNYRDLFPGMESELRQLIEDRVFIPGGRYLYATGKRFHQTQNCLLLTVEDSREAIADLNRRVTNGLMTGAGIGIVWSKLRGEGQNVSGMGGTSTGPCAFMLAVNEIGRQIMQGGSRRSAIWAGLHWNHPDVFKFIALKNWDEATKRRKQEDFNAWAPMDMTNISVILDDAFFEAYKRNDEWAHRVYDLVTLQMCSNGEPGFSIDVGKNAGEHLRNACTEVTSRDDNDICNLGSINMARVGDLQQFRRAVNLGTFFLLCGTTYSKVPYEEVATTRTKNRRLGLGLMGIHEWLLTRGSRYEPTDELDEWMRAYANVSDGAAQMYATKMGLSVPIATRAIAPTGTIAIIGETTSGIEPVFCKAFKRRYLKGHRWHSQLVVDASVKRLLEKGVKIDKIEDAYDLSRDVRRRLDMQAFLQGYVDQSISSTINLPQWGIPDNNELTLPHFRRTLMEYLPRLRGITCYPDGSRGGQPLVPVRYEDAVDKEGVEIEEGADKACVGGVCGI